MADPAPPPPPTPDSASKPRRPWHRLSLRRVRTLSTVTATVLCVMMVASSKRDLLAYFNGSSNNNYALGITGGRLVGLWATDSAFGSRTGRALPQGFSTAVDKRWEDTVTLAWRPYHIGARPGFNPGDTFHGVAVPLWLVAVPAALLAAYAHGVLVGFRRGDRAHCVKCGYNRSGLTPDAKCPECGERGRV